MTRPARSRVHAARAVAAVSAVALLTSAILPSPRAFGQAGEAAVVAAPAAGGTVTGTGRVTLSRQPDVLRMTIVVAAEGKDIKEALANLKADRETLAGKLKALGAAGKAVQFGEPRIGAAGGAVPSAQQRMMAQMIRMRQMGNRAAKPDAGEPEPVAVSLTATAEWPLAEASSPEAFLVSAYELREKLRAGGLAKAAAEPAKELTPEEQEEQEEMAAIMGDDGDGTGAPKPGEPAFAFVRRVTAEERDAATAEAFAKAKAAAARLAAAAGGKLGELRTVSGSAAAADAGDDEDIYAMQRAVFQQMGVNTSGDGADAEEATAAEPGPVTLEVTVTAAFSIR